MAKASIGLFVGSLRKASFSRKIANAIIKMAPADFEFKIIEIGDLPLYNQDFDDHNEVPDSYKTFRETVKQLNGVIFITPEYNRSVPAVLKNALDVASRPYGKNNWNDKPGAVFSSSIGLLSGYGANHHLRQSLVFLNVLPMQQPEVYLAQIQNDFDEQGNMNERCSGFLQKAVDSYIAWYKRVAR